MSPQEFVEFMRRNPQVSIGPHGDQAEDLLQPASRAPAPAYVMTSNKVPTEHEEQVALFQWAEASGIEALEMLHATPMGGYRPPHIGAMLKAEGARKGYPDISLDIPMPRPDATTAQGDALLWHGLRIELKVGRNKPTPEQEWWVERLRHYGYKAVVCYGAQEAINAILDYLGMEA
jgi:hypothetical protein